MTNIIKPIYEFLMWDNCNNNCKFCYQKQNYHKLNDIQKKLSISKVVEFINSSKYEIGSHVLLVGGEVFDSPSIFFHLNLLIDTIISKMKSGEIDLLYINTNLIYKKLDSLSYLLDSIKSNNLFHRLKFTTSYDLAGRFNEKTEKLMINNLKCIKDNYPDCNIVVNMMLSNELCSQIISRKFSIKQYCEQYRVQINLIPYIILDKSLTAPRVEIFKALKIVNDEIPGYLKSYIRNLDLPQRKILHYFNSETCEYEYCSSDDSECGHSENFKNYSELNSCFICDLKEVFNDYI